MSQTKSLPIWDIWIRLFHWSLAVAVGFLLYSGTTGDLFFDWHRQLGEFVLMLIIFRLLWGVVGSSNVRLTRLIRSPREAVKHIGHFAKRDVPQEREHNAAGAWAVVAMLLILGTQAVTGMFIADEDELVEGALYGSAGSDLTDLMYRIHHINSDLIKLIVILHVVMVLLYAAYARRNLISPMFTGKLKWASERSAPSVSIQRWWVGVLCLVPCAAGVGYLAGWF